MVAWVVPVVVPTEVVPVEVVPVEVVPVVAVPLVLVVPPVDVVPLVLVVDDPLPQAVSRTVPASEAATTAAVP